jgi:hypothetical protein
MGLAAGPAKPSGGSFLELPQGRRLWRVAALFWPNAWPAEPVYAAIRSVGALAAAPFAVWSANVELASSAAFRGLTILAQRRRQGAVRFRSWTMIGKAVALGVAANRAGP